MARLIQPGDSLLDAYDYVSYSAAAITVAGEDGDKEVGALLSQIAKTMEGAEELVQARRRARFVLLSGHARVRRRDLRCDVVVTALHHDVLGLCKQNRAAPLFVRFFPVPLSEIVPLRLEAELPHLRDMHEKLLADGVPAGLRKAHDKPLTEAIALGDTALRLRAAAERQLEAVAEKVGSWRERSNKVLLGVEGALTQIAAERGLGREWVATFFEAPPARAKGKKKDAPEGEQPK